MPELAWPTHDTLLAIRGDAYDRPEVEAFLNRWVHQLCAAEFRGRPPSDAHLLKQGVGCFCDHLDRLPGVTLADRWSAFEGLSLPEIGTPIGHGRLQTHV